MRCRARRGAPKGNPANRTPPEIVEKVLHLRGLTTWDPFGLSEEFTIDAFIRKWKAVERKERSRTSSVTDQARVPRHCPVKGYSDACLRSRQPTSFHGHGACTVNRDYNFSVPPVRLYPPCAAGSRPQHSDSLVTVGFDRRLDGPFGKKGITRRRFFSACPGGRFCSGGGRPRSWFQRGYGWPRCRHDLSDKRNGSPTHFNRPRPVGRIRLDLGSSVSTVRWPAVRQETANAPQHYENQEVIRHSLAPARPLSNGRARCTCTIGQP